MNKAVTIINLFFYSQYVLGRDFYMGIFRRDDFLVAQDNVFKEKKLYSYVQADYGRLFKCPITYFRVADRLGTGGPSVNILRGGLNRKYITIRIRSQYNLPISINIYVGCHNEHPRLPIRPNRTAATTTKSVTHKRVEDISTTTTVKAEKSTKASKDSSKSKKKSDKKASTNAVNETETVIGTDIESKTGTEVVGTVVTGQEMGVTETGGTVAQSEAEKTEPPA